MTAVAEAIPIMTEDVKVYTLKEVAEILDISTRTVRRLIKSKKLDSFKVGQQIRILHDDLLAYIEDQKLEAQASDA